MSMIQSGKDEQTSIVLRSFISDISFIYKIRKIQQTIITLNVNQSYRQSAIIFIGRKS
jgi:hypothetical protein